MAEYPDPRGPVELEAAKRLDRIAAANRRRDEGRRFWEKVDAARAAPAPPAEIDNNAPGSDESANRVTARAERLAHSGHTSGGTRQPRNRRA